MENNSLNVVEEILMEYSGPMGKFVIRKQLKDMNRTLDALNESEKRKLITNIVANAIYNDNYKDECRKKLTAILIGNIHA